MALQKHTIRENAVWVARAWDAIHVLSLAHSVSRQNMNTHPQGSQQPRRLPPDASVAP